MTESPSPVESPPADTTPADTTPVDVQRQDDEHLRLLSIFHYLLAGVTFLFTSPLLFFAFVFSFPLMEAPSEAAAFGVGCLGLLFAGGALLFVVGYPIALVMTGRFLRARTHYTFCFVVAVVSCLNTPLGTVLGVFTIVVLVRDSVKRTFDVPPYLSAETY